MWILALALIASADAPAAVDGPGVPDGDPVSVPAAQTRTDRPVRAIRADSSLEPQTRSSDRMRRARRHLRSFRTLRTRLPRRSRTAVSPDSKQHERITAVELHRAARIGRRVAHLTQIARSTHRRGRDQGRPPLA